jgi:preprotein translocase subunit Sec61beta
MAKNNKIQMPSSGAGLTRFSEDMHSKITIKPEHIVAIIIIAIVLVLILKSFGLSWLGIQ